MKRCLVIIIFIGTTSFVIGFIYPSVVFARDRGQLFGVEEISPDGEWFAETPPIENSSGMLPPDVETCGSRFPQKDNEISAFRELPILKRWIENVTKFPTPYSMGDSTRVATPGNRFCCVEIEEGFIYVIHGYLVAIEVNTYKPCGSNIHLEVWLRKMSPEFRSVIDPRTFYLPGQRETFAWNLTLTQPARYMGRTFTCGWGIPTYNFADLCTYVNPTECMYEG